MKAEAPFYKNNIGVVVSVVCVIMFMTGASIGYFCGYNSRFNYRPVQKDTPLFLPPFDSNTEVIPIPTSWKSWKAPPEHSGSSNNDGYVIL